MLDPATFQRLVDGATLIDPEDKTYLSLYTTQSGYGGPEEGGWEWTDHILVGYAPFANERLAEMAQASLEKTIEDENEQVRQAKDRQCAQECDWLEERGLDDDFLNPPTSPDQYYLVIESKPGENESQGCRHYE